MSANTTALKYLIVLTIAVGPGGFPQADETKVPASERLRNKQESVSGRYAKFERVLSQMADILGYDDPERAELLRRAIGASREKNISGTLDAIARDLDNSQFGNAVEKQSHVASDLQSLLKLLQSEDRMSAVERERERIRNLLKDVNDIKAQQRAARAKSQNSDAPSNAAPDQQQTLNKIENVLGDINEHDGEQTSESDSENSENPKDENTPEKDGKQSQQKGDRNSSKPEGKPTNSDKESKDGSQEQSKPKKSEPTDSDSKDSPGEPKSQTSKGSQGKGDKQSKSDPKPQQSQSAEPSSGKTPKQQRETEQTPGREPLQKAKNLMMEALEQLKEQEREKAIDKQDDAISDLQAAAAELEKMLQQLREEEKEMVLATLEARFQRLLALQTQVYDSTLDLAATPRDQWLDNAVGTCRELSQKQSETTQECSFTTSLLREDGTSVSILVAVEDIESDMRTIANRLQKTKVGTLTQSMETDVIDALKELIEATQREMAEMKNNEKKPPSRQQQGEQKKPKLVQLMQEIKVLRSLQMRVNKRMKTVNGLFRESDPDDVVGLQDQITELTDRQERLRQSAAELNRVWQKENQR